MENIITNIKQLWGLHGLITFLIITIQILIDRFMGAHAEYFNAYATVQNLTHWIHGRSAEHPMIYGQDQLGLWALPLATTVLVVAPFLLATLIVQIFGRIFAQG